MADVTSFIATTALVLGLLNSGNTLYQQWFRRPRLRLAQGFSYMTAQGSDLIVFQINFRMFADHRDIYIHEVYLINERPTYRLYNPVTDYDPKEVEKIPIRQFKEYIPEALMAELDVEDFIARIGQAMQPISTLDLNIPAGSVKSVTAAEVMCRPNIASAIRKHGWWLVIDYGVGIVREKVFTDI